MRNVTAYLELGFSICSEITKEILQKAGKRPDETKMAFCGAWGLSQEGLNNLYRKLLTDDSDDDSDDDFQENPPSKNSIKVRFSLFPNGLCVLADNDRPSRKHDNIRPTPELLKYSGLSEEQKQSLTRLIPPTSNVIAAGTLYLKQTVAEDGTTSVKIVGADSQSGHFRLTHSREVIQAYLRKIYPELIEPDFKLFDVPTHFKPSKEETRHINLTQDPGFEEWLGAINRAEKLSNLGHSTVITTKKLNPPGSRSARITGLLLAPRPNFSQAGSSSSAVPSPALCNSTVPLSSPAPSSPDVSSSAAKSSCASSPSSKTPPRSPLAAIDGTSPSSNSAALSESLTASRRKRLSELFSIPSNPDSKNRRTTGPDL